MNINRAIIWTLFGILSSLVANTLVASVSFLLGTVATLFFGKDAKWYFYGFDTWFHGLSQALWFGLTTALAIFLLKPQRISAAIALGVAIYTFQILVAMVYYQTPFTLDSFVFILPHMWAMGALSAALLWWQGKRTDWKIVSFEDTPDAQSSGEIPRKRQGFTLVEIIIVMAMIGILAGLLFPAIQRSRAQAHKASCISNLHQLGLVVQLYQQDYNCDGQLYRVPEKIDVLVEDYAKSPAIFVCPLDVTTRGYGNSVTIFQTSTYRDSYGYLGSRFADPEWNPDLTDPDLEKNEAKYALFGCQLHGDAVPDENIPAFGADGITEANPLEEVTIYQGLRLRVLADGHVKSDHHSYYRKENGISWLGSLDDNLKDFDGG